MSRTRFRVGLYAKIVPIMFWRGKPKRPLLGRAGIGPAGGKGWRGRHQL